jgi:aminoglycoside phosphotransferase (APT) family kinase protein
MNDFRNPLADLANLLMPWYFPFSENNFKQLMGFQNGTFIFVTFLAKRPLPVPEANELISRYCTRMKIQYPIPGWKFCIAFSFFRVF